MRKGVTMALGLAAALAASPQALAQDPEAETPAAVDEDSLTHAQDHRARDGDGRPRWLHFASSMGLTGAGTLLTTTGILFAGLSCEMYGGQASLCTGPIDAPTSVAVVGLTLTLVGSPLLTGLIWQPRDMRPVFLGTAVGVAGAVGTALLIANFGDVIENNSGLFSAAMIGLPSFCAAFAPLARNRVVDWRTTPTALSAGNGRLVPGLAMVAAF